MTKFILTIILFILYTNTFAQQCKLNEEAKRHWFRAEGFKEIATKNEDYFSVAYEYEEALKYAPDCPDIYYMLAHCQELLCKLNTKNCDAAILNYKKYLELKPNASNKEEVEAKIYGIEAKKEKFKRDNQEEERKRFEGCWKTKNTIRDCIYQIKNIGGNKYVITVYPNRGHCSDYLYNVVSEVYGYLNNGILVFEHSCVYFGNSGVYNDDPKEQSYNRFRFDSHYTQYVRLSWSSENRIHVLSEEGESRNYRSDNKKFIGTTKEQDEYGKHDYYLEKSH